MEKSFQQPSIMSHGHHDQAFNEVKISNGNTHGASSSQYSAVPSDESPKLDKDATRPASLLSRLFLDTWIPEILAIVCSAVCVAAVWIVVLAYQGKPTPQLPYAITLNAIVSILATTS